MITKNNKNQFIDSGLPIVLVAFLERRFNGVKNVEFVMQQRTMKNKSNGQKFASTMRLNLILNTMKTIRVQKMQRIDKSEATFPPFQLDSN